MNAIDVLHQAGKDSNWDIHARLEAACQYIDNQQDLRGFQDFVKQLQFDTDEPRAGDVRVRQAAALPEPRRGSHSAEDGG